MQEASRGYCEAIRNAVMQLPVSPAHDTTGMLSTVLRTIKSTKSTLPLLDSLSEPGESKHLCEVVVHFVHINTGRDDSHASAVELIAAILIYISCGRPRTLRPVTYGRRFVSVLGFAASNQGRRTMPGAYHIRQQISTIAKYVHLSGQSNCYCHQSLMW